MTQPIITYWLGVMIGYDSLFKQAFFSTYTLKNVYSQSKICIGKSPSSMGARMKHKAAGAAS